MPPFPSQPASSSSRGVAPASPGPKAAPRFRLKRLILLAAGLGAALWLWGWLSVDESGQPVAQNSDDPSLEIEGLQSLMVRRDGKPFWEFSARRVTSNASGTTTTATGDGRAQLFRDGQPFLRVRAPRVRFSNLSSNLEASGGLSAVGPDDFSFQTSRAIWRNAEKIVDCPKPAVAWLRNFYFQTPRLAYDWKNGVLRCPQSVEVRGQGVVLRGKKLEATLKPRIVRLSEGVEMIFDPRAAKMGLPEIGAPKIGLPKAAPNAVSLASYPFADSRFADKNEPGGASGVPIAMKIRPSLPLGVCLTTSALFAVALAQGARKPAPAAKQKVPDAPTSIQNGNVRIKGEDGYYDIDSGDSRLTRNVTVTEVGEDFILYAQKLSYNKAQNRAIASGSLRVDTNESTIRGERIDADFNTKIITITGNVVITTHGKKDGIIGNREDLRSQVKQKPARILSNRADWDYQDRQATITGNVRLTQEKNSGTCERILYDEPQNVAQLLGRVRFVDKNGSRFRTPDLTIYMNEGRIRAVDPIFEFNSIPNATPKPAIRKVPVLKVRPVPEIPNDLGADFATRPAPIPTPRPEPTEIPTPPPAEPDDDNSATEPDAGGATPGATPIPKSAS